LHLLKNNNTVNTEMWRSYTLYKLYVKSKYSILRKQRTYRQYFLSAESRVTDT